MQTLAVCIPTGKAASGLRNLKLRTLMSIPKGKLIAIGGAEDKGTDPDIGEIHRTNLNFFELGILRRIVEEAGGVSSRIEVITTASTIPY